MVHVKRNKTGKNSKNKALNHHRGKQPKWANWPDDRLLNMRMCDLGIKIENTPIKEYIEQAYEDLERRDIKFRPHFWFSEEWFTPEGIPGAAIPFYLAHPRLMRLERNQMLEVEGGSQEWCMRIIRHELGHTIDHAYRLHRKRRWQQLFGKSSKPYPEFYQPKAYSKNYVLHLDFWYAQSHPDEDFAETFAVWLKPRGIWRKRYQGWPALKKLEYVDELMREIAQKSPPVKSRARIDPVEKIKKTLREFYQQKRARYSLEYPDFYDHDLRRLFSDNPEHAKKEPAAVFLGRNRREVRSLVSRWTGEYQYTLDLVLKEMIGRCRELRLRVAGREKQLKMDFAILLTMQTMNHLYSGRHRVDM
jgi:hypothetical protein